MYRIVPFEPHHGPAVIEVVRSVHDEFHFTWDAAGYHRDLYEIDECYLRGGGLFSVLLDVDQVIACVGVTLHDRSHPAHDPEGDTRIKRDPDLRYAELHRLYLYREQRGLGLGKRLLDHAMDFARTHGCKRMVCWSDTVLKAAHALYLRNGFVQCGDRICNDPDQSREFGFWKEPL